MDRSSVERTGRAAGGSWSAPPERPRASVDVIDVWRADRVQSRSRELLLAILSRYLDEDPGRIALVQSAAGKPQLGGRHAGRLRFNLSHSEGLTLIAVTAEREVGIDVEVLGGEDRRGRLDEVAIARRTLGSEQAQRLERMEGRERRVEFLRAWTRYEAQIKCLGVGLGGALAKSARGRVESSELWVQELDVAAEALAAVAAAGLGGCEVRRWEWADG
jgi:4'-phosphopantetheinyl transferase